MSDPIRLIAYSDYLCPWCYNASRRLHRLQEQEGVEIEWRSYLLRPSPGRGRDPERFRAYTQSWQRPAAEPDGAPFQPWASEEPPPSHSIPPHQAAKAAARQGPEAFRRFHDRLLAAYFEQSRDISSEAVLAELWADAGLEPGAFAQWDDPEILRQVLAEHDEALECGATGVPSVRLSDREAVITGALPYESYVQWVTRERARREEPGT